MPLIDVASTTTLELVTYPSFEVAQPELIDYCSIEDAEYYLDQLVFADDWEDASPEMRSLALNEASDLIRALAIPAYEAYADVPQDYQVATAEIALKLLGEIGIEPDLREAYLVNQATGSLRLTNFKNEVPLHVLAGIPSTTAWEILRRYISTPKTISFDRKN